MSFLTSFFQVFHDSRIFTGRPRIGSQYEALWHEGANLLWLRLCRAALRYGGWAGARTLVFKTRRTSLPLVRFDISVWTVRKRKSCGDARREPTAAFWSAAVS